MAGTSLAGQASRGALRGGLGCQRGRQKEIDDIVSVTGAGPCRRGIGPPGRLESNRRKTALPGPVCVDPVDL